MQKDTYNNSRYLTHNSEYLNSLEDIEDEIYYDLKNTGNRTLFRKDYFKKNGHIIDILSPEEVIPGSRSVLNNADTVRFMLSLYPYEDDLLKIASVVLQPRHIEINGIELAGIYVANEKMLVLYMHSRILFHSDDIKFDNYSKILTYALSNYYNEHINIYDENAGKSGIPSLWYVLSTISFSTEDRIEKFFIRTDNTQTGSILHKLSDISFYYSRLGY
ncbi:MAG: hypothetical protein JW864_04565 [Spirochaetes bacterium]|nr:hypothetical protein [Spirochaetota bacterium]